MQQLILLKRQDHCRKLFGDGVVEDLFNLCDVRNDLLLRNVRWFNLQEPALCLLTNVLHQPLVTLVPSQIHHSLYQLKTILYRLLLHPLQRIPSQRVLNRPQVNFVLRRSYLLPQVPSVYHAILRRVIRQMRLSHSDD